VLVGGVEAPFNVNFGNRTQPGSALGQVWNDVDGDGVNESGEPGLAGWTVFLDDNNDGQRSTNLERTVDSDLASAINNAFEANTQIWFDDHRTISDVDVTLNITHTYDNDLTVELISPTGTVVELFSGVGGSSDNFQVTTLDDDAANSITTGSGPFNGTFRPEGDLNDFVGENGYGIWTLRITDSSAADNGSLNGWSLKIVGDELAVETDANGNYEIDNLSPGDYNLAAIPKPAWIPTLVPDGAITILPGGSAGVDFGARPPIHLFGDFDRNTVVDASDFVLWRKALGSPIGYFEGPDGDGDGLVDDDDYDVWQSHFGDVLLPGPGAFTSENVQSEAVSAPTSQLLAMSTAMPPLGLHRSAAKAAADRPSTAIENSDLALIAWLAEYSTSPAHADEPLSDGPLSSDEDAAESIDDAFDELELGALAGPGSL
jgi:subtilisin-like proprotein convertase family protein